MKPQSTSRITLAGSGKRGRRKSKLVPTNDDNLRAWRVGLIKAAWLRVVARVMAGEETRP